VTFVQNLGQFLNVTGPQYGHIAWWLASVDWPSDAARDDFAVLLGGKPQEH
jgi:hypothetical protein